MRKELIKELEKRGEKAEELRRRYERQVQKIKDSFPKESAERILDDLTYEDFLKDVLDKKLLKDKRSQEED